jgi:hypothetical protein
MKERIEGIIGFAAIFAIPAGFWLTSRKTRNHLRRVAH